MPRFAGTKRVMYSQERVLDMRMKRKKLKPKKEGVDDRTLQHSLGELMAAGHLRINGFSSMKEHKDEGEYIWQKKTQIEFQSANQVGMEDRPHITGYLRSSSSTDKDYRIKGWFNEDGTIRLELVK